MKGIETGRDKVKKICDILRRETLEPAQEEAASVVRAAKLQAEEILKEARALADKMQSDAKREVAREKNIFQSSLGQACRQALESLREQIETQMLNGELAHLVTKQTQDPHLLAEIITAVVRGIEKEGLDTSLSAYIPASIPPRAVNQLLVQATLEKLKEKSVLVGHCVGGIEIVLHKEKVTIELSDVALKELVALYIRKDFRSLVFS
jgi:V/A-type H+-transporting ATPase subunit E